MTFKMERGCVVILCILFVTKVNCSSLIFGTEAESLCQAYKKVCRDGKVCAVQTLRWPRRSMFPVCVHRDRAQVRSDDCHAAPSPGGCGSHFRRWYFSVHTLSCSWFTYTGCGGNANNFVTRERCERACLSRLSVNPDLSDATHDVSSTTNDVNSSRRRHSRRRHGHGRQDRKSDERYRLQGITQKYNHDQPSHINRKNLRNDNSGKFLDQSLLSPFSVFPTTATSAPRSARADNTEENRSDNAKWKSDRGRFELSPRNVYTSQHSPTQNRRNSANFAASDRSASSPQHPTRFRFLYPNSKSPNLPEVNRRSRTFRKFDRQPTSFHDRSRSFAHSNRRFKGAENRRPDEFPNRRLQSNTGESLESPPTAISEPSMASSRKNPRKIQTPQIVQPFNNSRSAIKSSRSVRKKNDVTPDLTSSPEASYAAVAQETTRTFPQGRPAKRSQGRLGRNSRRRRRLRRRRRKRKGRRKQDVSSSAALPDHLNNNNTNITDSSNSSNPIDNSNNGQEVSSQPTHKKSGLKATPDKSQMSHKTATLLDKNVQKPSRQPQNERQGEDKKKRKKRRNRRRRRRRRREKGKKRRKRQRGRKDKHVTTGGFELQSRSHTHEKIPLLGSLDGKNATAVVEE